MPEPTTFDVLVPHLASVLYERTMERTAPFWRPLNLRDDSERGYWTRVATIEAHRLAEMPGFESLSTPAPEADLGTRGLAGLLKNVAAEHWSCECEPVIEALDSPVSARQNHIGQMQAAAIREHLSTTPEETRRA